VFRLSPNAARAEAWPGLSGARVVFDNGPRVREDARAAGRPFPRADGLTQRLITRATRAPQLEHLPRERDRRLGSGLRLRGPRPGQPRGRNKEQARVWTDQALAAAEDIAEAEDRELVLSDLESIPGQPRYW
jgi:hypothetical protein